MIDISFDHVCMSCALALRARRMSAAEQNEKHVNQRDRLFRSFRRNILIHLQSRRRTKKKCVVFDAFDPEQDVTHGYTEEDSDEEDARIFPHASLSSENAFVFEDSLAFQDLLRAQMSMALTGTQRTVAATDSVCRERAADQTGGRTGTGVKIFQVKFILRGHEVTEKQVQFLKFYVR